MASDATVVMLDGGECCRAEKRMQAGVSEHVLGEHILLLCSEHLAAVVL